MRGSLGRGGRESDHDLSSIEIGGLVYGPGARSISRSIGLCFGWGPEVLTGRGRLGTRVCDGSKP